jgi:hypothetical protein
MEFRNRKVDRRMGTIMPKRYIAGEAQDIETVIRLRPWIEDEWRNVHGKFSRTKLITDYDAKTNIFKFQLHFIK